MQKEGENNFGILGVVFGILSITFALIPIIGIIFSIFGIIFSLVQRKRAKNRWALAGLILSTLGLAINILVIWWLYIITLEFTKQFQEQLQQMQQIQEAQQLAGLAQ